MQLQQLKNQIRDIKASIPPRPVRGEILFYAERQDGDQDDETHFFYSTPEERDAIRERLHARPDGDDVARIIVHGVTPEEIAEQAAEQDSAKVAP
jgi:hypothetical protein